MKALKYLSYLLLLVVILVTGLVIYAYSATHNPKTGTIYLKGLQGNVTVTRDEFGTPHIIASKSDEDAFFALGFVHAQDRFWQMEFQRRVARGTLSEIFGKATIKEDKFLRTWGFYRAAQAAWPAFDSQTKTILHAYTAGVNAFLAQDKLPLQFKILHYQPEPWSEIDAIAWEKMMAFDLQNAWSQKITNYLIAQQLGADQIPVLRPQYPADAPTILSEKDLQQSGLSTNMPNVHKTSLPPSKVLDNQLQELQKTADQIRTSLGFTTVPGIGSNNWVVAGSRTISGKPLLANDPHLELNAPGIWYLAELRGPHLHASGGTIPGSPGVLLGHNDHIAWGATNVNPDTQDLYVEPTDAPLTTIHEIIKVKGESDIDLPVKISAHGPIISDVSDAGKLGPHVAIKWTALMPNDTTLQSFMKLEYAQNWDDFTQAMKYFVVPSQNFVYADIKGNIGYYMPGLIPIRSGENNGMPIFPQQHNEWQGFIPFEKMPHVLNPPEGYLASANNKAVPDDYLYPLTFRWRDPPYRISRIVDLLNAKQKVSPDYFQDMQTDTMSYLWRDLRPALINTQPLDENSKQALEILKAWNGDATLDSKATTIFAFWYRELMLMPIKQLPFADTWIEPLFIKQQLASNGSYCRSSTTNTCAPYLRQTLQQAMHKLTAQLGDHWRWQNIHHAVFSEVGLGTVKSISWIWNRSIATPGSDETVDVGVYKSPKFIQNLGPGYRQIIDFGDLDGSLYMAAFGQSDDPFDKHHADLMPLWRDGEYVVISSQPEDWGTSREQMILKPAK
jgi:penicillin amidase